MSASALCRWHRAWIAGASVACLGLSGILVGGCTPLSSDLSSSQAKQQQVAKLGSAGAGQKTAKKTAQKPAQQTAQKGSKKTPPTVAQSLAQKKNQKTAQVAQSNAGRVRITDGATTPDAQIAAKGEKAPVAQVAAKGDKAAAKQVASKGDKAPAGQVASNTRQPKTGAGQKAPAAKSAAAKPSTPKASQPETELTADWADAIDVPADGKKPSLGNKKVTPIAGTKRAPRKPAAPAKDPFLSGPTSKGNVDELTNDTLPEDAVVAQTTSDMPRPQKPDAKKTVEPQASDVALGESESPSKADRLPRPSNHERQRANVLMERAYGMYRSGFPEEALRLASVAAELEKSRLAIYRKGEERPTDFITWLQSADGGRSASPPVIRPDRQRGESAADLLPQPTEAGITATSVAVQTKRPLGEILRADGGSILQPRDQTTPRAATTRTNAGMELLGSETSRFQNNDNLEQRASANSPQVAATAPPSTTSADAASASQAASGPRFDPLATNDAPAPPPDESRIESRTITRGPAIAAPEAPVEKNVEVAIAERHAGSDAEFTAEPEVPGLIPGRTTQLTLVGIIGLVTGVAGMAGLSWWHIQERRHAAGK
ncbi:MAG: hypothetical protein HY290_06330 [Planctomycetia bacterium]|nr:hypothetical protein [Planctomycetia bacterium]